MISREIQIIPMIYWIHDYPHSTWSSVFITMSIMEAQFFDFRNDTHQHSLNTATYLGYKYAYQHYLRDYIMFPREMDMFHKYIIIPIRKFIGWYYFKRGTQLW